MSDQEYKVEITKESWPCPCADCSLRWKVTIFKKDGYSFYDVDGYTGFISLWMAKRWTKKRVKRLTNKEKAKSSGPITFFLTENGATCD